MEFVALRSSGKRMNEKEFFRERRREYWRKRNEKKFVEAAFALGWDTASIAKLLGKDEEEIYNLRAEAERKNDEN